jgi:hypothetical protein
VIATASELFKARHYPGVVALITDALEAEPDCVPLLLVRARAQIALRRDLEAQADLRDIIRLDPQCSLAYRLLGELAARRDENESAAIFFREALRLDPADQEADTWLAIVQATARPAAVASKLPAPATAAGRFPSRFAQGTCSPDDDRPTARFSGTRDRLRAAAAATVVPLAEGSSDELRVPRSTPIEKTQAIQLPVAHPRHAGVFRAYPSHGDDDAMADDAMADHAMADPPSLARGSEPNVPHRSASEPGEQRTRQGAQPIRRPLSQPSPSSLSSPASAPPMRELPGFGEYLVSTGILTRERLRAAQAYQRSMKVQLSTAIVTLGLATPQRIEWAAVAHQSQLSRGG